MHVEGKDHLPISLIVYTHPSRMPACSRASNRKVVGYQARDVNGSSWRLYLLSCFFHFFRRNHRTRIHDWAKVVSCVFASSLHSTFTDSQHKSAISSMFDCSLRGLVAREGYPAYPISCSLSLSTGSICFWSLQCL